MNTFFEGRTYLAKVILLTSLVIASFKLQFWVISSITVYLIIREVIKYINANEQRYLRDNLFQRTIYKKEFIIKDSLQYLKSCRMIYFGYDYRSNTNIILQLQRENPNDYELSAQEYQIYEDISKIYKQTVRIISQLSLILQIQPKQFLEIKANINSFDDIFTANRLFENIFSYQNNLIDIAEDIITSVVEYDGLYYKIKSFKTVIPRIKHRDQQLKSLQNVIINIYKNNVKKEYEEYYNFFTGKNCTQNQQKVKHWIESLQNTLKIQNAQQKLGKAQYFFDDDQKLVTQAETSTIISAQEPKQSNITIKKAQFLKKLDKLLMIGMARRKQQEQQKKMCNFQENSDKID